MTREEKSNLLNELLEIEEKNDIGNLTRAERREFQQWVEGLEQEPILDKIRAEIEQEIIPRNSDQYDHEAMWQNMGLRMALKVIGKYKTESEEENG